jgi:dihydroorotate dehydrogenase electron transfer subunit
MVLFQTLPVASLEKLNSKYFVLLIKSAELASNCAPGMFCELKAANQRHRLFKPISVYAVENATISFLIKIVGEGTQALSELTSSALIQVLGPLGTGFPLVENKNVLLVSGGVGYPPLAYLKSTLSASNKLTFLHGGASAEDVFPCDRAYTLDGCSGFKGLVTQDIPELLKQAKPDVVYSCGPLPMLKAVHDMVHPIKHFASLEAYMACGVGVCHGCAVPVGETYQRVCKEGPVFDAASVRWEEL